MWGCWKKKSNGWNVSIKLCCARPWANDLVTDKKSQWSNSICEQHVASQKVVSNIAKGETIQNQTKTALAQCQPNSTLSKEHWVCSKAGWAVARSWQTESLSESEQKHAWKSCKWWERLSSERHVEVAQRREKCSSSGFKCVPKGDINVLFENCLSIGVMR